MKSVNNICKFVTLTSRNTISTTNFVLEADNSIFNRDRSDTDNVMHLVISGSGFLNTENSKIAINTGTLFFTFAGMKYSIENDSDLKYIYISFSGQRSGELFSRLGISSRECVFNGYESLITFWQNCLGKANESNLDLISESVLFYTFSQMSVNVDNRKRHLIGKVLKFIEDGFMDGALSLENVACALGYSAKYISRVFKAEIGITFTEYLKNVRMQHAVFLMEQGITSIKNVAFLSGYRDPLYFSNVFKKTVGVSPSEYINKDK